MNPLNFSRIVNRSSHIQSEPSADWGAYDRATGELLATHVSRSVLANWYDDEEYRIERVGKRG